MTRFRDLFDAQKSHFASIIARSLMLGVRVTDATDS
jgi:hypothetical protein